MFYESQLMSKYSSHHCDHAFLTVLDVEQTKLRFNYSPKEKQLTMVPQPLGRLYNSNDTIAEKGTVNQHKINTMMNEFRDC